MSASIRTGASVVRVHALCASLSLFGASEFPVRYFSELLAVSRTMVAGESGRRTIELSPVRGNRRGTDVRQVLGIYLGGGGWEEVRRYASRGVLGCTGGEHRSDDHLLGFYTRSLLTEKVRSLRRNRSLFHFPRQFQRTPPHNHIPF
jgi:hypothetical protein